MKTKRTLAQKAAKVAFGLGLLVVLAGVVSCKDDKEDGEKPKSSKLDGVWYSEPEYGNTASLYFKGNAITLNLFNNKNENYLHSKGFYRIDGDQLYFRQTKDGPEVAGSFSRDGNKLTYLGTTYTKDEKFKEIKLEGAYKSVKYEGDGIMYDSKPCYFEDGHEWIYVFDYTIEGNVFISTWNEGDKTVTYTDLIRQDGDKIKIAQTTYAPGCSQAPAGTYKSEPDEDGYYKFFTFKGWKFEYVIYNSEGQAVDGESGRAILDGNTLYCPNSFVLVRFTFAKQGKDIVLDGKVWTKQ